jgi:hypothetical protein
MVPVEHLGRTNGSSEHQFRANVITEPGCHQRADAPAAHPVHDGGAARWRSYLNGVKCVSFASIQRNLSVFFEGAVT